MEVKLDSLIEKIKKEGIEEAQQTSGEVVGRARQEAQEILDNARREAERTIEEAKQQAARIEENGKLALQQATRDIELLLKQQVDALFTRVFRQQTGAVLDPEFVKQLILKLAQDWGKGQSLEVEVSAADRERLQALLAAGVAQELQQGISLSVNARISKGFHIGMKGEDAYFDFTAETVGEVLKSFLSPTLKQLLDGQSGKNG